MKNDIQHIYWFAHYNLQGASTRYRGYYPMQLLKNKYEIEGDFVFPTTDKSGAWSFLKVYLTVLLFRKKDSIVVIQKVCSNRLYANLLKFLILVRSENTHYDIDDAEYLRQDVKTLHFFLKRCKSISAGSVALKEYCKKYNNNVHLLTSPVIEHGVRKVKRNKIPNIGWVGDFGNGNAVSKDFSHKNSMYSVLFPQLNKINRPIIFTLIGVKNESDIPEIVEFFKDNSNIKVNFVKAMNWANDEWLYPEIMKFDIGVSPLTGHLFNTSKSAFKAKQYLSVGVPTIGSDVGENNKFVKENVNGFLCKSDIDFERNIYKILAMSDNDYFELSRNAFESNKSFSMRNYCDNLIGIFGD